MFSLKIDGLFIRYRDSSKNNLHVDITQGKCAQSHHRTFNTSVFFSKENDKMCKMPIARQKHIRLWPDHDQEKQNIYRLVINHYISLPTVSVRWQQMWILMSYCFHNVMNESCRWEHELDELVFNMQVPWYFHALEIDWMQLYYTVWWANLQCSVGRM